MHKHTAKAHSVLKSAGYADGGDVSMGNVLKRAYSDLKYDPFETKRDPGAPLKATGTPGDRAPDMPPHKPADEDDDARELEQEKWNTYYANHPDAKKAGGRVKVKKR